ncbi:MAG: 2-dehydropantoate 2-reductase, partial [Lysinibacillus sp.]
SVTTTKKINVVRNLVKDAQITIVTTKSYHLQHLYDELAYLPESAAILFMQNGLAHYEPAISLPQRDIAFSSVQFGALKENDAAVRHTGVGIWKLAIGKGSVNAFEPILKCSSESFPIELVSDAYAMLFEKALLNCFINPLTAILQVKNGVLVENKAAYTLLEQLYDELLATFPNEMADFPFHSVVSLCEKTATNTSSMLMDRLSRRPSEVDAIVRPIIERAQKSGQQLPTLKMLYTLMVAIETERERQL